MKTFLVTGNFYGEIQEGFFFFLFEGRRGVEREELILQFCLKGERIRLYALHHLDDTHGVHAASGDRGLQI